MCAGRSLLYTWILDTVCKVLVPRLESESVPTQSRRPGLKLGYIEFGVVRIHSAISVCIHSAILQLLLTRPTDLYIDGLIAKWMSSA